MNPASRVTAIVGSYRKGGVIDTLVDDILSSAREAGAETTKIHLMDVHIEFCRNCRACTQEEGPGRGECQLSDEMDTVLREIERSDAFILASPMNCGTVTAVMKRFMERIACYAYWPWGMASPKDRNPVKAKRAVIVGSSAAPSILARLTTNMVKILKQSASFLGAKEIDVFFIGLAAMKPAPQLSERTRKKARALGGKLASGATDPRSGT